LGIRNGIWTTGKKSCASIPRNVFLEKSFGDLDQDLAYHEQNQRVIVVMVMLVVVVNSSGFGGGSATDLKI